MIENSTSTQSTAQIKAASGKVLHMVKNDRMAGSVPSWDKPKTEQDKLVSNMEMSVNNPYQSSNFEAALALRAEGPTQSKTHEEFGFGDLVDMVNPLHHIPLVGSVYRDITGDEIKPIGKIIGGGVFGGAIGAASGLVNAVVEEETGKDMAGNALGIVMHGEKPRFKSLNNTPHVKISNALQEKSVREELPADMLAFTDQSYKGLKISANDRLKHMNSTEKVISNLPPREPISSLTPEQLVPFREL